MTLFFIVFRVVPLLLGWPFAFFAFLTEWLDIDQAWNGRSVVRFSDSYSTIFNLFDARRKGSHPSDDMCCGRFAHDVSWCCMAMACKWLYGKWRVAVRSHCCGLPTCIVSDALAQRLEVDGAFEWQPRPQRDLYERQKVKQQVPQHWSHRYLTYLNIDRYDAFSHLLPFIGKNTTSWV